MFRRLEQRHARRAASGGFSIIELAIVILVMMILLAIIVPGYRYVGLKSKEVTLKQDLQAMRKMIDQYTADKEKAPQSLEELVEAGYLPEIPVDPMTDSSETWEVVLEDQDPTSIKGERGIRDVKSGSGEVDSSGQKRYSDW
jgi:general secretion pathway protein G